jgi:large subunit ribosomal protein L1
MGKKRPVIIDDSAPIEEKKEKKPERKKILGTNIKRDEALEKASEPTPEVSAEAKKEDKASAIEAKKADKAEKLSKAASKKGTVKYRSKKYLEAKEKVERNKLYPINEATQLVKEVSYTGFEGSLEIHINTSLKNVRGLVSLPFASGKKLKIAAFGKGAEESGADLIGDDALFSEIERGKLNFDVLITTPEWMPKFARAAKVLGPRGLMPNPKNGTISADLKKVVTELQGGKVEYKSETKANVIHLGIGKISQPSEELSQNIKVLLSTIGKTRVKKATIAPTMGPGIKLDLSSI